MIENVVKRTHMYVLSTHSLYWVIPSCFANVRIAISNTADWLIPSFLESFSSNVFASSL